MISWCGCCHIQRDFYISTSGSFLKCSEGFWVSGGSGSVLIQFPKPEMTPWCSLIAVVKALCAIHRVRANLKWLTASKLWEQIVGFNIRELSVSGELHRLMWNSRWVFLIIVWFSLFMQYSESVSSQITSVPVVKWVWGIFMLGKLSSSKQRVKIMLQEMFWHRETHAAPPCHHKYHRYTLGNPTLT